MTEVSVSGREQLLSKDRPEEAGGPGPGKRALRLPKTSALIRGGAAPLGFVVMVVLFSALRPNTFPTTGTLTNLIDDASIPVILACGLTFILACGQFDLSFTGSLGLTAALAAILLSRHHWSTPLVIGFVVLCGLAIGAVVGAVVALRPRSTFIVSLSLGSVLTGIELAVSDNKTVYSGIPQSFTTLANTRYLHFYGPDWLALVVAILAGTLLHFTRFGRHVSSTGSNADAAFLAGVRVKIVWASCFVIMSVAAALAALSYTAQTGSYIPNSFSSYLLSTYAAVFLGSTVASGRFTVFGSVFGVIWLTTLQTGLIQLNEPLWTSNVVEGLVLAVAVFAASRGWRSRK